MKKSKYGVLLAVSSLPSRHGIGDFGNSAYEFIDCIASKGYKYWQILPLNPVGPGNSPYMSTCSEAIDPRYIDLDELTKLGLINDTPDFRKSSSRVDYQAVKTFKVKYLLKAFEEFNKTENKVYKKFVKKNHLYKILLQSLQEVILLYYLI